MKLLQISLMLVAGALVGTLVTKLWLRPHRPVMRAAAMAPAVTSVRTRELTPPAGLASAAEPARLAPLISAPPQPHRSQRPAKTPASKLSAFRRIQPSSKPAPVILAQAKVESVVVRPPVSPPPPNSIPIPPAEPQNTASRQSTPREPSPHQVTLTVGLLIPARLKEGLSSERNRPGDPFTATIDQEIVVDGFVIVERGAPVEGRVTAVDRGTAQLTVELTRLYTADRQRVAIQTESFEHRSENSRQSVDSNSQLTRGAPATLPADTRIRFRLLTSILLTEKLRG